MRTCGSADLQHEFLFLFTYECLNSESKQPEIDLRNLLHVALACSGELKPEFLRALLCLGSLYLRNLGIELSTERSF